LSPLGDDLFHSIQRKLHSKTGQNAEAYAWRLLRNEGWAVIRSARGPIDVIAAKNGAVLLILVKRGSGAKISAQEAKTLVIWADCFNADGEIWWFKGRSYLEKRRVFARQELDRMTPTDLAHRASS
jgi:Holliday junction resolvase